MPGLSMVARQVVAGALMLVAAAVALAPGGFASAQTGGLPPPTGLSFAGNALRWSYGSSGQDGFRIVAYVSDPKPSAVYRYTVGPDVRQFPVPPEASPACPDHATARYQVLAFRGSEESAPIEVGVIGECPPTPAPTSAPALPRTGAGGRPGTPQRALPLALLAAGAAALATGVATGAVRRRPLPAGTGGRVSG